VNVICSSTQAAFSEKLFVVNGIVSSACFMWCSMLMLLKGRPGAVGEC
jgi:hypothetical protein